MRVRLHAWVQNQMLLFLQEEAARLGRGTDVIESVMRMGGIDDNVGEPIHIVKDVELVDQWPPPGLELGNFESEEEDEAAWEAYEWDWENKAYRERGAECDYLYYSGNFDNGIINEVWEYDSPGDGVDAVISLYVIDADEIGSESDALEVLLAEGWRLGDHLAPEMFEDD